MSKIYENELITIQTEKSQVPWLILFTKEPYKEMSNVPAETRLEIYTLLHEIELLMLDYYKPSKVNIASFGNYRPEVHWHIMARFENDNYFPEPMWGTQQRENTLSLPSFEDFCSKVKEHLKDF